MVVTRLDRLGRTSLALLQTQELLQSLNVSIFAVLENVEDPFEYELRAVLAAEERRRFLKRSKEGLDRAAGEGRYIGGIVPLGYVVEGKKATARLVPSDVPITESWTESALVRQIYQWVGVDGWSCVKVAEHMNALKVPTAYTKDGRLLRDSTGRRLHRTENVWRPGRIRNLLVNTVYKGLYQYGRRTKYKRNIVTGVVPALISEALWNATQAQLSANRLVARHGSRVNLLRSLVRCSICGLTYVASRGNQGVIWYRCGGQTAHRGKIGRRCPARSFRADWLEPIVRDDVRRWLLQPDDALVAELRADMLTAPDKATGEAEREVIEHALTSHAPQRERLIDLRVRDLVTVDEFERKLAGLADQEAELRRRLQEVVSEETHEPDPLDTDLALEIRRRVEGQELSDETWQELISILVDRIEAKTEPQPEGKKKLTLTIVYRFDGVDPTSKGTGSWQQ